jgi:hypothetical protein
MRHFLIEFRYEHYCQGYEWVTTQVLVEAKTFVAACAKIQNDIDYSNATDFVNKTL